MFVMTSISDKLSKLREKTEILKLTDREIRERERDLNDAIILYEAARKKIHAASSILREALSLYKNFLDICNRSPYTKYGMVAQKLHIRSVLTVVTGINNRLSSLVRDTTRTQTLTMGDIRQAVMDPNLTRE
jgi:hypothetical protein